MLAHHSEELSMAGFLESLDRHGDLRRIFSLALNSLEGRSNLHFYKLRYPYGHLVVGPRHDGYFSKLLPPCGFKAPCNDCKFLLNNTQDHRPLILVLSGAVEEFLEFEQTERKGRRTPSRQRRCVSLRLAHPGEFLGIYEALNAFYFDDYGSRGNKVLGNPARRLASGARSIFINARFAKLAAALKNGVIKPAIASRYYRLNNLSPSQLANELDADHWRCLKMFTEAAEIQWETELLVIPFATLKALIWDNKQVRPNARELLLEIHRLGWMLSRHSRSGHIRNVAVADLLAAKDADSYIEQTIQHLLAIGRGELPGFAPFNQHTAAGPFREILGFINHTGISKLFDCFPSILQPAHLGHGQYRKSAVYYSFKYPTLPFPLRQKRSMDLMRDLKLALNEIRTANRSAIQHFDFKFFRSAGLSKPGRIIAIFAESRESEDFNYQKDLAKDSPAPFFGLDREGFLSKFIRLSANDYP